MTDFDYPSSATGERLIPDLDTHLAPMGRLRVLAALATTPLWCRVSTVQTQVNVAHGMIYKYVRELAEIEYAETTMDTGLQGRVMSVRITPRGRDALSAHALALADIIVNAESLIAPDAVPTPGRQLPRRLAVVPDPVGTRNFPEAATSELVADTIFEVAEDVERQSTQQAKQLRALGTIFAVLAMSPNAAAAHELIDHAAEEFSNGWPQGRRPVDQDDIYRNRLAILDAAGYHGVSPGPARHNGQADTGRRDA